MIGLIARFILPLLGVAAVVAIPALLIQNHSLRAERASLTADLITARADLELSQANVSRLQAGIDGQNTAIDQHAAEGEARRSATESRLEAFPTVGLPVSFDAPLTGATACERAEDARSRLIESLQ